MPFCAAFLLALQAAPVDAQLYSTMASYWANRPEFAMDGDPKTAFQSYGTMEDGDAFVVLLSHPASPKSIRIVTGTAVGEEKLTDAFVETTADGTVFTRAAAFNSDGVATVTPKAPVLGFRIRTNKGKAASRLVIREIEAGTIGRAQRGSGRGFWNLNGFSALKGWADKAERQMESFWAETAAILYSDGFITPNAVNLIIRDDEGLPPGMMGGGTITVDAKWAKAHPEDTGLTVHEAAHAIQSGGNPGWLVEAVADYVRWIRFEPENFTYRIDLEKGTARDPYRSGAAFLAWCENHYDRKLVTKLNDDTRFGRYKDSNFEKYCGKSIDVLYKEFIAAYKADPKNVLKPPMSAAMQPRTLPTATSSTAVEVPYAIIGTYPDGATFRANGGFDDGGAAYAGAALGKTARVNGVTFNVGAAGASNTLPARGQTLRLSGKHKSVWLLGAAIEGGQRDSVLTVTYADGSTARWDQNFSDWYASENFPGELRAVRMPYRVMANGSRDERPFNVYAYGFTLDPNKEVRSLTLPNNPNIRILSAALGD